jgi:hypothetical protein
VKGTALMFAGLAGMFAAMAIAQAIRGDLFWASVDGFLVGIYLMLFWWLRPTKSLKERE